MCKTPICTGNAFPTRLAGDAEPTVEKSKFAKNLSTVKNSTVDILSSKDTTHPKDIKINLNPSNANAVQYYKAFSIERENTESEQGVVDHEITGFFSNFRGTNEPGLVMHGSDSGNTNALAFRFGLPGDKKRRFNVLTHHELINYMRSRNINLDNYPPDTPLHLIACYSGGENGTAQKLANALGRPVKTYTSNDMKVFTKSKPLLGNKNAIIYSGESISSAREVKEAYTYYPEKAEKTNSAINVAWKSKK